MSTASCSVIINCFYYPFADLFLCHFVNMHYYFFYRQRVQFTEAKCRHRSTLICWSRNLWLVWKSNSHRSSWTGRAHSCNEKILPFHGLFIRPWSWPSLWVLAQQRGTRLSRNRARLLDEASSWKWLPYNYGVITLIFFAYSFRHLVTFCVIFSVKFLHFDF